MAETIKTRMTAEEFLALPESNQRMELINGELITYGEEGMSPSPVLDHQRLVMKLIALLLQLGLDGEIFTAPTDVHLDEANIVQPDLFWIAPESQCGSPDGKHLHGAPDLIIEVLSPGTGHQDKVHKFHLYEQHGVREYWIADPVHRLLEVWVLDEGKFMRQDVYGPEDTFESLVLGGKAVSLQSLFDEHPA